MGFLAQMKLFEIAYNKGDIEKLRSLAIIPYAAMKARFGDFDRAKLIVTPKLTNCPNVLECSEKELHRLLCSLEDFNYSDDDIVEVSTAVPSKKLYNWKHAEFKLFSKPKDLENDILQRFPECEYNDKYGVAPSVFETYIGNLLADVDLLDPKIAETEVLLQNGVPEKNLGLLTYFRLLSGRTTFKHYCETFDAKKFQKKLDAIGVGAGVASYAGFMAATSTTGKAATAALIGKLSAIPGVSAAGEVVTAEVVSTATGATLSTTTGTIAAATTAGTATTAAAAAAPFVIPAVVAAVTVGGGRMIYKKVITSKSLQYSEDDLRKYCIEEFGPNYETFINMKKLTKTINDMFCMNVTSVTADYRRATYSVLNAHDVPEQDYENTIDDILAMIPGSIKAADRYLNAYKFSKLYFGGA